MPGIIATLVSLASMALMVFMIYRTLTSFRQERPLNKRAQYLAMASPVLTLAVYLVGARPSGGYLAAIAVAGLAGGVFGLLWSRTTELTLRQGQVVGRNTIWWLAFWGASFVMTQGMTLLRQQTGLNLSLVLMAFSTGVAVTVAVGLLQGIEAVLAGVPSGPAPQPVSAAPSLAVGQTFPAARYCESCGSPVVAGSAFCEQCGSSLASQSLCCESCGSPVMPGSGFCEQCGQRLG
jgi:hypothetical protein